MKRKRITEPRRRAATAAQKREIEARQGGLCFVWGCVEPIAIFEHWHCVGLGNQNPPDCGLCKVHAKLKTYGSPGRVGGDIRDIKHIRKLEEKRTQADRRAERGPKLKSNAKLKSRGFDKTLSKHMDGTVTKR